MTNKKKFTKQGLLVRRLKQPRERTEPLIEITSKWPVWVINPDKRDKTRESRITEALKKIGVPTINFRNYWGDELWKKWPNEVLVLRNSIWAFPRHLQEGFGLTPVSHLSMTTLFAHWGEHCLNESGRIVTLGWLIKNIDHVGKTMEDPYGRFFVRPNDCDKMFAGTVTTPKLFERKVLKKIKAINWEHDLVLINKYEKIDFEYRFVVAAGRVVAQSPYRVDGNITFLGTDVPEEARNLADKLAADRNWQPGWAYVIDIAMIKDRPWVIELNDFEKAVMYNVDPVEMIVGVSEAACIRHEATWCNRHNEQNGKVAQVLVDMGL